MPARPSSPAAGSDVARAASRPAWRPIALLALAVTLLHLLLLGLLPTGFAPPALPLAERFSVRTIEIAPPPAAAPSAAAPAHAAAARPRPHATPRPVPRPAPRPRPQPAPPRPEPPAAKPTVSAPSPEPDMPAESPTPQVQDLSGPPAAPSGPAQGPDAGGGTGNATGDTGHAAGTGRGNTPGADQALRLPGSIRLEFDVSGQRGVQPMQGGRGELLWLQDGAHYNARLSAKLLFFTLLSQTSVGRIDAGGIAPERYADTRHGGAAAQFARDQGQIVFSANRPGVPLLPGAQDRVSVVMQLAGLLAGDPSHYPPGTQIAVQTAGTDGADVWQFQVQGDEAAQVPAGSFATRKLTRLPRRHGDQQIELWLAPALHYLPVRLRQTQADGDVIDLQLRASGSPN